MYVETGEELEDVTMDRQAGEWIRKLDGTLPPDLHGIYVTTEGEMMGVSTDPRDDSADAMNYILLRE